MKLTRTPSPSVFTSFPTKMAPITPSDTVDLVPAAHVRANEAGTVTFIPAGNDTADTVVVDLVAGEFIPCLVRRVLDTGTDSIELHAIFN